MGGSDNNGILLPSVSLTLIITRPKKCLNADIAFGTGRVHDDVGQR